MLAETLGHYRILRPLGKGGMGEVYAAQDTKLGRSVALKLLPQALSSDPSRRERFEREARAVAALNHPHIVTLHSVEEADGVPFLTMELIEGKRLSELIPPQGMALNRFLQLAIPLADAVSAAHKRGIVHRDLKPANVMVTEEGQLKVLDFGLAKLKEAAVSGDGMGSEVATWEQTDEGRIVGTAAYMSPEQAEGKPLDARSDVFSLGIVIYEMTTGRRPFQGDSSAGTLSSILKDTPVSITELRPELPSDVGRIIRRCLEKDPARRMQTALDLRNELEDLKKETASGQELPGAPRAAGPVPQTSRRGAWSDAAGARPRTWWSGRAAWLVLGAAAGAGLLALMTARPLAGRPVVRWSVALPPAENVAGGDAPAVAFSPDGTQLAYVAADEGRSRIYLRALDRLEATPIPGTEGGNVPFFSPDGRWLGFFVWREHKLKKVPLGGGAPLTVCDVAYVRGASWGPDGTIVFTRDGASGLDRVSAEGGTPQVLTTLDKGRRESSHRLPEVLPGGEAVVFTVKADDTASFDDARIEAISLRTRQRSALISGGTSGRYAASGHLIYARAGALWAAPFDPVRLKVTGPSVGVIEGVSASGVHGSADFSISAEGSLVYVPGKPSGADRRILRVDRSGKARQLMDARRAFTSLRLSPDGRRIALSIEGANDQIWVYDLERGTLTPQTLRGNNNSPIWTPDGRRLTFTSTREGPANLFWQPVDGSGSSERLTVSEHWQIPLSWSPDGKTLLFREEPQGADVWIVQLDADRKPRPLLQGAFNEWEAMLSPNGRWLAYESDESGRREIYVRSFADAGSQWPISSDGGSEPVWARNGSELYYRNGDRMMAVMVTATSDGSFSATKPRLLFETKSPSSALGFRGMTYDLTADGEFLTIETGESDSPRTHINVVLNWLREVQHRSAAR